MRWLRVGLVAIIAYILFMPSLSAAQLPRGNWWEREEIKKALQFSEEQVEKIKKIAARGREKMEQLRKEYSEKSKTLRGKMNVEKLRGMSEEEIARLIDELQDIRGRIEKTRFLTMVKTLKVLTEEQAARLVEKQKELRKKAVEKFRQKKAPGSKLPPRQEGKQ